MYFFDWLKAHQDFENPLPLVARDIHVNGVIEEGEIIMSDSIRQKPISFEGSFCTTLKIRCNGHRLTVEGNPSRFNRLDNLFGLQSLDECFRVFNTVLRSLGVPEFTKCTRVNYLTNFGSENYSNIDDLLDGLSLPKLSTSPKESNSKTADGAVIERVDITTNKSVGAGNVDRYLEALSTQKYRNSLPNLYANGKTLDFISAKGNKGSLVYPTIYNKENELSIHSEQKIKNKFGEDSREFQYFQKVKNYCASAGVARFEQKIRSRQLQRMNAQYWGLFEQSVFDDLQREFINIDQKLKASKMTFQGISRQLIEEGVCKTTRSANTTAQYCFEWMHGETFDLNKRQVQEHRARLKRIGIDISLPCNVSLFSPVKCISNEEIISSELQIPSWYQVANGSPVLSIV